MVVLTGINQGIGAKIKGKIEASSGYGNRKYGAFRYAAGAEEQGIYQVRTRFDKKTQVKEKLYIPTNPQTGPQQAWRQVYTDSIVAWHNLTDEQKEIYNENAIGQKMSGYNLFQKEYLLSH